MGRAQINVTDEVKFQDHMAVSQIIGFPPGTLYYVSANGGNTDGLFRGSAFTTLASALAVAGAGDAIYVLPGHTETLSTSGITLSRSGVSIVGGGNKRNRPTLTCGAADVSGLTVSGNNNRIHNIRFVGSTSQTGAASACLAVSGTDNHVSGCQFEHGGAGPLQAVSLAAAHRILIENCHWLGTSAGPDMAIKATAAACNDVIVRNCIFNYGSVNVDSAVIGGLAGGGYPGAIFENLIMLGANSSGIRNLGSYAATVPDGIIKNVYGVSSTGINLAGAMPFDCGGLMLADCFWSDAVASAGLWLATQQTSTSSAVSKGPILSPGMT